MVLPAMMLLYLVFPLFHQWKNYKTCIAFGMYISTVWICTVMKYDQIMILLHRIPLMFVTYELSGKNKFQTRKPLASVYLSWEYSFCISVHL